MFRICSFFLFVFTLAGEPADWIWSARYVITEDAQRRVIENGAVAIRGDRIVGVGAKTEIDKRFQPKQRLDRPDAILAPGLINTHTHAAMSLFRGIADDLRLQDWLEKYIFPAEAKNVSPEFVRWGTRLGCLEMLLGGTTTFTDMYYFEDVVAEVAKEAGMRGVLGETIIGFPVPDAKTPADALKFTERYLTRFRNDPLVVPAVAPHALYTNTDATLKAARALANKYNAPLIIHLAETKKERDDAVSQRHMTPTKVLDTLGVFAGRTIAAHCVWVNEPDMAILKSRGVGVAHCPSSNMKLGSGVTPVVRMLALGIAVGLGPDGPAGSNNDFNMFEEMDLAAKLAKVTSLDPQVLPAATALEMATIRGARVLGMEKEIGSLETGKRADLIMVRLDRPNAVPLYGPVSQMVYALKADDVRDVMVNGKPVVRDAKILTLDEKAILAKAEEYRAKVSASLGLSKVQSGLIAPAPGDAAILAGPSSPEPTDLSSPSSVPPSDARKSLGFLIPGRSASTENFDSFRVRALSCIVALMAKLAESPRSHLAVSAPSEVVKLVKAWVAKGLPDDLSVSSDVFLKESAPRPGAVERFFPADAQGNWRVEEFFPENSPSVPAGSIYFIERGQALSETRRLAQKVGADARSDLGNAYHEAEASITRQYGGPGAYFNLGVGYAYNSGLGVPQDRAEAARWFRKAAEQGNASAQLNLGALYLTGEGVPKDYSESYFWIKVAAAAGQIPDAKSEHIGSLLDSAAAHLTAAALSKAQERARQWLAAHATKTQ